MKVFTTVCVLLVASLAYGRHLNDAHVNDAKPKSDETKAAADQSADAAPQKVRAFFVTNRLSLIISMRKIATCLELFS